MGAQKKVIVRRFAGGVAWGYLPPEDFVQDDLTQLMGVDGRLTPIAVNEIKLIAYVRDFNLDDPEAPERLSRKTFPGRPRGDGVWLRAGFLDGDVLEGLAGLGLGFLDTAIADGGFFLTPPDQRGNTMRVFVPRTALRSLEVLGWVTAPSKRPAAASGANSKSGPAGEDQPRLFE
jgi:hypothetical protein